jgi:phage tail tube protein FII
MLDYFLNLNLSLNQQKWLSHYQKLCERGLQRKLETYKERHHIVPRCLGGIDDLNNLVDLTPEEHYVAHQLLVKILPTNADLIFAAHLMGASRKGNKTYGWLRKQFSLVQSEKMKGRTKENNESVRKRAEKIRGRTKETNKGVAKMAATLKGRTKFNNKGYALISELQKGRTKENHNGTRRQAEKMKGRTKETNSGTAKMAVTLRGRTKENHQGVAAQAEKIRGRRKETDIGVAKMAAALTGRTKETHNGIAKQSEKVTKFPLELKPVILQLFENGLNFSQIKNWIKEHKNIEIKYHAIYHLCLTEKKKASVR